MMNVWSRANLSVVRNSLMINSTFDPASRERLPFQHGSGGMATEMEGNYRMIYNIYIYKYTEGKPPMGHLSQIKVKINTAESAIMHVNPYKSKHTMDVIRFMLMLKTVFTGPQNKKA